METFARGPLRTGGEVPETKKYGCFSTNLRYIQICENKIYWEGMTVGRKLFLVGISFTECETSLNHYICVKSSRLFAHWEMDNNTWHVLKFHSEDSGFFSVVAFIISLIIQRFSFSLMCCIQSPSLTSARNLYPQRVVNFVKYPQCVSGSWWARRLNTTYTSNIFEAFVLNYFIIN